MYETKVDLTTYKGITSYARSHCCDSMGQWRVCGDFNCPDWFREYCKSLYTASHASLEQLPQYIIHTVAIVRQAARARFEELLSGEDT